jgi:hypothetical protein
MKPIVSIVVEAYNEEQNGLAPPGEALDGLRCQDFPLEQAELILIGSAQEIEHWKVNYAPCLAAFGAVRTIAASPDAHYWELKNQGAQVASADIIAFTDCDVLPGVRWLSSAVRAIQDGADASVGPSRYRTAKLGPDSAWMMAAALPSWAFQLARQPTLQAASLLAHNLVIRRDLLLKHPFPVFRRSFGSSLLYYELIRSGARFSYQPEQSVSHAMNFRWWLGRRHFRTGWETYSARELSPDWPRVRVLRRLPLVEPVVLRMGMVCRDARHWFRFTRVLGLSPAAALRLFPVALAASFCARSAEMAGMYAALFAPKSTEHQARF